MKVLVILGCSATKKEGSWPAKQMYSGWRNNKTREMLSYLPYDIDIYYISAEHGLIHEDTMVEHYDNGSYYEVTQTERHANRSRLKAYETLENLSLHYDAVLAFASQPYLDYLSTSHLSIPVYYLRAQDSRYSNDFIPLDYCIDRQVIPQKGVGVGVQLKVDVCSRYHLIKYLLDHSDDIKDPIKLQEYFRTVDVTEARGIKGADMNVGYKPTSLW